MSTGATAETAEQILAARIAVLMRLGTVVAAILLAVGTALWAAGQGRGAAVLLTGGCGLLVLLPVIRLVMMVDHFARRPQRVLVLAALAVLVLVLAGAVVGLVG